MKVWILALGVFLVGVAAATPVQHAQFSGYLTDESATAHDFGSLVALGGTTTLELSHQYSVELHAASSDRSVARLIGEDGAVLHEAETTGPAAASPSLAYRVCGGQVTFISPAPTVERVLGC